MSARRRGWAVAWRVSVGIGGRGLKISFRGRKSRQDKLGGRFGYFLFFSTRGGRRGSSRRPGVGGWEDRFY